MKNVPYECRVYRIVSVAASFEMQSFEREPAS